jgi:hypothetical protein
MTTTTPEIERNKEEQERKEEQRQTQQQEKTDDTAPWLVLRREIHKKQSGTAISSSDSRHFLLSKFQFMSFILYFCCVVSSQSTRKPHVLE